jgi:hypothetical protein
LFDAIPVFTDNDVHDTSVRDSTPPLMTLTPKQLAILRTCTSQLLTELFNPPKQRDSAKLNTLRARIKRFYKDYELTPTQNEVLYWCVARNFKHQVSLSNPIPKHFLYENYDIFLE